MSQFEGTCFFPSSVKAAGMASFSLLQVVLDAPGSQATAQREASHPLSSTLLDLHASRAPTSHPVRSLSALCLWFKYFVFHRVFFGTSSKQQAVTISYNCAAPACRSAPLKEPSVEEQPQQRT